MLPYRNSAGNSGVHAYQLVHNGIRVQFSGGDVYLYTFQSAGRSNIERMQQLAAEGRGLSTFISRYVKDKFERKE